MNRYSLLPSHQPLSGSAGRRFALISNVVCVMLLLSSKAAMASLTFLDTFDVSAQTTDLSFENSVRQSGSAAPLTYLQDWVNQNGLTIDPAWWQLGVPGYEGWLYLNGVGNPNGPGGVGVSTTPNHSFIENTNFTVDFDIIPFSNPSAGGWAGIKILDSTGTPQFVNGGDGFGMLINPGGDGYLFDGGNGLTSFPSGFFVTSVSNHVTMAVMTDGFDGSGSGHTVITLIVNGTQIGVYTINHNYSGGYISLFYALASVGQQNVTAFDNLKVQPAATVAPTLTIVPGTGHTVLLEWPVAATGFMLQTNTSLSSGVWGQSALPITIQGSLNVVTNSASQAKLFYRLSKP